ncbi:MAG TPA: hypothetical protein PKE40_04575 [Arachnia sp.]|nr:hypothetical protein [Arachnia sp.]HMT85608.1 hypothetical protein [Arachnia sp.]
MNKRGLLARSVVGALGGCLLVGVAGVAMAAPGDTDDVLINVNIAAAPTQGDLTMTVAAASTSLTEVSDPTDAVREFTGTLPNVTVEDDRDAVPAGVFWYVTGQSSDFTGASNELTAGNLGWAPNLVTAGNGEVMEGDVVDTVLDTPPNNVGLEGEELLAMALDSADAQAANGSWTANAGLVLKTPGDVTPGAYTATLTLTLWEDAL